MELIGHVRNGVIVLDGGPALPEGKAVRVIPNETVCRIRREARLPFRPSNQPGSRNVSAEMMAEILLRDDCDGIDSSNPRTA